MNKRLLSQHRLLLCAGLTLGIGGGGFIILPSAHSQVQEAPAVVRVEEDWVMVLNEPEDRANSPQFHTVMSPVGHLGGVYAQVLWNYREVPDFVPGGVQLQSYERDYMIRCRSIEYGQLSTTAETITWSQSLETDGNVLSFEIFDGNSTTWGEFGRDMRIDENVPFENLNAYSPATSAENTCVTYGSNRVDLLMIMQVRYYDAEGHLVAMDTTPRIVFQFGDDE